MKTVLVPIDFSPVSGKVVAKAAALAKACNARLVLCHVNSYPAIVGGYDVVVPNASEVLEEASEQAERRLDSFARRLTARGLSVRVQLAIGVAAREILSIARSLRATYIVVGSHGHGAFYDLIAGSTTNIILKGSRCPVVVVPAARKT